MTKMTKINTKEHTVGFFRLFASVLYDTLLLSAILFFATLPLALIPDSLHSLPLVEASKVAWYLLVSYIYFAGFWLKGGQTPGMKSWKITIDGIQTPIPTKQQVTIRFFSAIFSWSLAGLGFLWMIIDPEKYTLHDHLSKTRLLLVKKP